MNFSPFLDAGRRAGARRLQKEPSPLPTPARGISKVTVVKGALFALAAHGLGAPVHPALKKSHTARSRELRGESLLPIPPHSGASPAGAGGSNNRRAASGAGGPR